MSQPSLVPEHHAASNRLRPGALQQPPHGFLLLDETVEPVQEPSAEHQAQLGRNLRALRELVHNGVLECAYAFQQVRLPLSGSAAILSRAPSHFVSACHAALRVAPAAEAPVKGAGAEAPVQSMRAYLASAWECWRSLHFEPDCPDENTNAKPSEAGPAAVPAWVSSRLVQSAKALCAGLRPPGTPEPDTARSYDTIAMLLNALAVSKGKTAVGSADWADMEELCKRVAARNHAGSNDSQAASMEGSPVKPAGGKGGMRADLDPAAAAGGAAVGAAEAAEDARFSAALLQALEHRDGADPDSADLVIEEDAAEEATAANMATVAAAAAAAGNARGAEPGEAHSGDEDQSDGDGCAGDEGDGLSRGQAILARLHAAGQL